jgi:hypothetical protein
MIMKRQLYTKILSVLKTLHTKHPTYNLGRHISTALDEYGDLWNVSDKEFLFAMEKYMVEQELDIPHESEEDINKIINEGMHLEKMFAEEELDEE